MAYEGWMTLDGTELINLSRTTQLAPLLGIDVVRIRPSSVQWIEETLVESGYDDITNAPWYDAGHAPSREFAGIVPLTVGGLDDSSREAQTIEYVTDGGSSSGARNTTQPLVFNVLLVASTERGAEFGKRWLDRRLRENSDTSFCSGSDLHYFQYGDLGSPVVHRRDVSLSRGSVVTRKKRSRCAVTWMVTFTMTANDPYEYGEQVLMLSDLGGSDDPVLGFGEGGFGDGPLGGSFVFDSGSINLVETGCPVFDYSPVYDPLYPALVSPPTAPDFYPEGWNIEVGMSFTRYWARTESLEPSFRNLVPVLSLSSITEARRVRFSVFPSSADTSDQCNALWSVVVNYLPPNQQFVVDGERTAAYIWDGSSPAVRRTDSLVFGPDASPIEWALFSDPNNLLVTLDIFTDTGVPEGGGNVRAELSLVPRSD